MVYYLLSPDETSGACGLLAQLVEHIVHIDGVTGSSPVQTTQSSICKGRGFFEITRNTFDACLLTNARREEKENAKP